MSDKVIRYDITINTNADYKIDFQPAEDDETLIDMTGWIAEAQLREFPEALDYLAFSCSTDDTGFHLTMDHEETAKIAYTRGAYDLFIIDPDNNRTKLAHGRAIIYPRSTR